MSFRLILIHFIYRVVFGVGIAALMWVGGNLIYAKTYQFYAKPEFIKHPEAANIVSGMRLLPQTPLRARIRGTVCGCHNAFRTKCLWICLP